MSLVQVIAVVEYTELETLMIFADAKSVQEPHIEQGERRRLGTGVSSTR